MNYINSMLEAVGNTPLLKLNKIGKEIKADIFVKLEHLNPSGSYKDRMALSMVEAAERGDTWNGKKLSPEGIVCDVSAGNCAPALAFVCAVKGYRAKLGIYKPMLHGEGTRLKITGAFGTEVSECKDPSAFLSPQELEQFLQEDSDLTYIMAGKKEMYQLEVENPLAVWMDQIYNKYNYLGQVAIGKELLRQLDGKIDAFGCAVGSGATLLGVITALESEGLKPLTYGVVPHGAETYLDLSKDESNWGEFSVSKLGEKLIKALKIDKWQTEKSIIEMLLDKGYPDKVFRITSDEAREMANRLCSEEGVYCGMSSGANVCVAMKLAAKMEEGQNVVTVIVDRRDRYLGEYPQDKFIV
jgi:cysteine synthase